MNEQDTAVPVLVAAAAQRGPLALATPLGARFREVIYRMDMDGTCAALGNADTARDARERRACAPGIRRAQGRWSMTAAGRESPPSRGPRDPPARSSGWSP